MKNEFEKLGNNSYKIDLDFKYESDELPNIESFKFYKRYNNLKIVLDTFNTTVVSYRVLDAFLDFAKRTGITLDKETIHTIFYKLDGETKQFDFAILINDKIVMS